MTDPGRKDQAWLNYWPIAAIAALTLVKSFVEIAINPDGDPTTDTMTVTVAGKSIGHPLSFFITFGYNLFFIVVFFTCLHKISKWNLDKIAAPIYNIFEKPMQGTIFSSKFLSPGRPSQYMASFLIIAFVGYLTIALKYLFK